MINIALPSIGDYEDVLAKNNYQKYIEKGQSPERALARIQRACRDSARTPVQWDGGAYAGFSERAPLRNARISAVVKSFSIQDVSLAMEV